MKTRFINSRLFVVGLSLLVSGSAFSSDTQTKQIDAKASLIDPNTVTLTGELDFGTIIRATTAKTVSVKLASDQSISIGGEGASEVSSKEGQGLVPELSIVSAGGDTYSITYEGGKVSNGDTKLDFTIDLSDSTGNSGDKSIKIPATLSIPEGTPNGEYSTENTGGVKGKVTVTFI